MQSSTANNDTIRRIYLDNSASTAADARVVDAMNPYWSEHMGNAGSLHEEGRNAKNALEEARKSVAKAINTQSTNIVFTSGGTESNNMAILGVVHERKKNGKNDGDISLVTSAVEHKSILDSYTVLERNGTKVAYVQTDEVGKVDLKALEEALKENTVLVSLIYVNNEIGTIQNIESVVHLVRKFRKENEMGNYPLIHIDASQAPAWIHLDVQKMDIDLLSLDSQKMYGPKGVGCLYIRDRKIIEPILFGGGQEFGLRPGTPPVPLIVGFAKALELVEEERETYVNTVREMRDWCIDSVLKELPDTEVNGPLDESRVAGNINFTFPNIDGEQLVIEMDVKGVAISTASACLSEAAEGGSHVIRALNKKELNTRGTVRLTLSRYTTQEEVERGTEILIDTVKWLQSTH